MIKIPKTVYIGINFERKNEEGVPLGFLTPGGTDKAAMKRKATVNSWIGIGNLVRYTVANDPESLAAHEIEHPDMVRRDYGSVDTSEYKYLTYYRERENDRDYKILEDVENLPMEGFSITRSIARYGGWNGGNKWVRVEDPRGFELEISVDNLVKLMSMTTFIDGVCQEECLWARDGSSNVLIPVNSDLYEEAQKNTVEYEKKRISPKGIPYGAEIKTLKTAYLPEVEGTYLGKYTIHFTQLDWKKRFQEGNRGSERPTKIVTDKVYIVRGIDGVYHLFKTLHVIEHNTRPSRPMPASRPDIIDGPFKVHTALYYKKILKATI